MSTVWTIWNWIDAAKAAGVTTTSSANEIDAVVAQLPPGLQVRLQEEYVLLYERADRLVLWEACSLLLGQPSSDDSFEYFRNWLIWGGQDFFDRALDKPDNLAELCAHYGVDIFAPHFEALSTLATHSIADRISWQYESLGLCGGSSLRTWNWQESSVDRIAQNLPRLWKTYGKEFKWGPPALSPQGSSFDAPGLGRMKIGDRVRHKFGYGDGVITDVVFADGAVATVKFADGSRPVCITSEHYEKAP